MHLDICQLIKKKKNDEEYVKMHGLTLQDKNINSQYEKQIWLFYFLLFLNDNVDEEYE